MQLSPYRKGSSEPARCAKALGGRNGEKRVFGYVTNRESFRAAVRSRWFFGTEAIRQQLEGRSGSQRVARHGVAAAVLRNQSIWAGNPSGWNVQEGVRVCRKARCEDRVRAPGAFSCFGAAYPPKQQTGPACRSNRAPPASAMLFRVRAPVRAEIHRAARRINYMLRIIWR